MKQNTRETLVQLESVGGWIGMVLFVVAILSMTTEPENRMAVRDGSIQMLEVSTNWLWSLPGLRQIKADHDRVVRNAHAEACARGVGENCPKRNALDDFIASTKPLGDPELWVGIVPPKEALNGTVH